ncbi:MAG: neutral zinc metallopeptidase [[Pasteurella] aerogenes]|nr:neutral zinc metallopeptidase [[Pasteurella] aerogenes]
MRWQGRRESTNVEDRRSGGSFRRGGKSTGIFGIIILLIGAYYGVDLSGLVGTPDFSSQQSSSLNSQEEQELNSLSRVVLADTESVWGDYFAQQNQGYIVPDSFTHGTSAQRLAWFKRGLQNGDPSQCNTFTH